MKKKKNLNSRPLKILPSMINVKGKPKGNADAGFFFVRVQLIHMWLFFVICSSSILLSVPHARLYHFLDMFTHVLVLFIWGLSKSLLRLAWLGTLYGGVFRNVRNPSEILTHIYPRVGNFIIEASGSDKQMLCASSGARAALNIAAEKKSK